jgi:elongation factor P hydroxylase
MLYRGDSVNKSNINITEPDDDKFFNSVHNYYISKGLKERANNSSKFFKSYKTTPNFNFNNYKDLNYPFKYIQ